MSQPKTTISLHINEQFTIGVLVRTVDSGNGAVDLSVLSRKTGQWMSITAEQLREQDIPSECIFAANEMPESSKNEPTGSAASGNSFTTH